MENIEKVICNCVYDFVKSHISEVTETYVSLGFRNEQDMLSQIKTNIDVAVWAMTELCCWAMRPHDYCKEFFIYEEYCDEYIYVVNNRYFTFTFDYGKVQVKEVKKVTKMVEITTWE